MNDDQHAVPLPEPAESYKRQQVTLTRREVRRLNQAHRDRLAQWGAVRVQVAYFRCPWPCTFTQFEGIRKRAIDRWVRYMDQNGWQLASRVKCRPDKRRMAHDLRGDWYTLARPDLMEIPVAAAFKKVDMEITRTEVPVQDDEDEG